MTEEQRNKLKQQIKEGQDFWEKKGVKAQYFFSFLVSIGAIAIDPMKMKLEQRALSEDLMTDRLLNNSFEQTYALNEKALLYLGIVKFFLTAFSENDSLLEKQMWN